MHIDSGNPWPVFRCGKIYRFYWFITFLEFTALVRRRLRAALSRWLAGCCRVSCRRPEWHAIILEVCSQVLLHANVQPPIRWTV